MTISALLDVVESHEFAARLNVASNIQTATEIGLAEPAVRMLIRKAKEPSVGDVVLTRVLHLTQQTVDVRYENPNDAALFIYLMVLDQCTRESALIAAAAICQMPGLWWSSSFAAEIIDGVGERNDMAGAPATFDPMTTEATDRIFVWDPRGSISLPVHRAFFVITNPEEDSGTVTTPAGERSDGTDDVELIVS